MSINFSKYQATGNDFVVINGDIEDYPTDIKGLTRICDRRFGIGADGVIIVRKESNYDFEVLYYNPDGTQSFCGNGTRSAVHFANQIGLIQGDKTEFKAYDGIHTAELMEDDTIRLQMQDVQNVRFLEDGIFVDTGSPHLVRFVPDLESVDVMGVGRRLRYDAPVENGTNVNFIQMNKSDQLSIRTYERGVENETYSCGTGVTASAIAASTKGSKSPVQIKAQGGTLNVEYKKDDSGKFYDIYLTGPAECVYQGTYEI